jgi:hypothetical protein
VSCASAPNSRNRRRDPAPGDGLLRPRRAPKMMYPLVPDLADDGIPVTVTCRVLGCSKRAFYKWRADPVSRRDWDDAHLINAARQIHHDDPEFGYGSSPTSSSVGAWSPAVNRVNRLCAQQRLWSVQLARAGHRRHARAAGPRRPPVHDELVTRSFGADAHRTSCGRPTSPSAPSPRASSTSARSRTPTRTGSWGTRWMPG